MKKKYYIRCPNCGARMRRTGVKEITYESGNTKLYKREYKCPNCESYWVYDEYFNSIREGGLDT